MGRTKVRALKRLTYKQVSCMDHATILEKWKLSLDNERSSKFCEFQGFHRTGTFPRFDRPRRLPLFLFLVSSLTWSRSLVTSTPIISSRSPLSVIFIVARRTVHFSIVVSSLVGKNFSPPFFLYLLSVPTLKLFYSLLVLDPTWNIIKRSRTYASYRVPWKLILPLKLSRSSSLYNLQIYLSRVECVSRVVTIRKLRKNTFAKLIRSWVTKTHRPSKQTFGRWLAI